MVTTNFQKIIDLLEKAMNDISTGASEEFIESTTVLIHEAMSGHHRRYHTIEHIFNVLDPKRDAELVLAALFHDIVYWEVDEGFIEPIKRILDEYITIELDQIFVRRRGPKNNMIFPLVNQLFGLNFGQILTPQKGMNEYLTALVFAHLFMEQLPVQKLLGVLACIEASIPFRGKNEEGKGPFEVLEERLTKISEVRMFDLSPEVIFGMVEKATRFANLDVGGFAVENIDDFIEQGWRLFPEYNRPLLQNPVYSAKSYREAMGKMSRMFSTFQIDNVFHQYRQAISDSSFKKISRQAHQNASLAQRYFQIRHLSMGFIEALCMASGGDLPLNMILANCSSKDAPPQFESVNRLEKRALKKARDVDEKVLSVLRLEDNGLAGLEKRPFTLAHHFYFCLGEKKINDLIKQAERYFSGQISAEDFLYSFDLEFLNETLDVFSDMVSTRRHRILGLMKKNDKNRTTA